MFFLVTMFPSVAPTMSWNFIFISDKWITQIENTVSLPFHHAARWLSPTCAPAGTKYRPQRRRQIVSLLIGPTSAKVTKAAFVCPASSSPPLHLLRYPSAQPNRTRKHSRAMTCIWPWVGIGGVLSGAFKSWSLLNSVAVILTVF